MLSFVRLIALLRARERERRYALLIQLSVIQDLRYAMACNHTH